MLDGHAALKGAAEAVPNDTIVDVAIVFPPGTTSEQLIATGAGEMVDGLGGVGELVADRDLDKHQTSASIVLALSDSTLYLLGRHRVGPFASFKNLAVIATIARADAKIETAHAGIVQSVTITDSSSGQVYDYEAKPMGSGLTEFAARLHG